ncbi:MULTISPECIES: YpdA family putative bacillithiol disulfide reductase [unclassified Paenibacillus]|uniref:YpdA family putative bacillithiol disulfide reductase n=1 Tax=unclassified Paenibacillus TaxID=185978 RepID=UPI002406E276|nr:MULTISPECIES: YpdA family putative bacillithiol disulfide reductase [unclassified Paenibacillus]MDF9841020.1 thioredoxin reductase (NADPH) [Paenibacillus sp. PastF-2]MDF9847807.1 thioredoxin reductase (NADPH) [Paenibacillus sp. PastM-2]MDF9854376.1 thioredoxin reductase (NADPH) [Paenibacillus sp. PastF-1]MDH6479453.1 thioredoxin reductase (NADPH) [Paenibacillus sp. PastH-2]MDH6505119.1 thioredoxin reductase (NADPH) [Paenibacillus sp. PastM-3]
MKDVIIIGAGPCGLSAAIECQRQGLSSLIIEKNFIVHSIYLYPTSMQFFSTTALLEIGGVPFTSPNDKPFRHEALVYYRRAAEQHGLEIAAYEEALSVERNEDGSFTVHTVNKRGERQSRQAAHVVISTGYFDQPNMIGIPGEELPKVTHYFGEAHPYTGMRVTVIGGSNSAVDAALELIRVGAAVDMVYRGASISDNIKPWVRPIFESMVTKGLITLHLESRVTEITPSSVIVTGNSGETSELDNDFVLAMTGFRPSRALLSSAGVQMDDELDKPSFNPSTMESNIPGLYVAGVIASGRNANEVFIETGRGHGKLIADHIVSQKLK